MSYDKNISEGKYIKRPSLRMTQNWDEHKANDTTGQDYGSVGKATPDNFQFTHPCSGGVRAGEKPSFASGTGYYLVAEIYHYTIHGIKFTGYYNHTKNLKAGPEGDTYSNHIHANYQLGHLSMNDAYNKRNSSMSFEQMDKYIGDHKQSTTQYYINLDASAGEVGCYDKPGGKKLGSIKPQNYGGLTYKNVDNIVNDSQEHRMAKINTDSYGFCYVTCEYYEGRSRNTTKEHELVN